MKSMIATSSFVAFCAVLLLSFGNEQCQASPNPDLDGNAKDSAKGALLGLNIPINAQIANVAEDHEDTDNHVYHYYDSHHDDDNDEGNDDEDQKHKYAGEQ
ncbi:hypothetical protein H4219_002126 [Mycoemilia scoparia]|uniref:Secreted protein n=1 Tax=Mycoemilia scoparia TaxID=417184 RepID=A0A9W8DUG0_9FUNG|nr:hypothetical protein H4219_002126 [Mycoemilia scoparia]